MTAFELPEEYRDWVNLRPSGEPVGPDGYLEVKVYLHSPRNDGMYLQNPMLVHTQYLKPPKPKPTLPDVGPGAVISYTSRSGTARRCFLADPEDTYRWCSSDRFDSWKTDEDLLDDVNGNGFTVELEGL